MVSGFLARGWAVIAPDGLARPGSRFGPGWSFHPSRPRQRDELAFTREVLADAARRFDIDRSRVLLAGFSVGGSLVWYLACADPGLAAAYAPVAGAFWRPHPAMGACAGPVRLLHTHGWRDETVPLEGRPLGGGGILQGDVFHGLEILRDANGCTGLRADAYDTSGPFWRRWWTRCTPGSALATGAAHRRPFRAARLGVAGARLVRLGRAAGRPRLTGASDLGAGEAGQAAPAGNEGPRHVAHGDVRDAHHAEVRSGQVEPDMGIERAAIPDQIHARPGRRADHDAQGDRRVMRLDPQQGSGRGQVGDALTAGAAGPCRDPDTSAADPAAP